MYKSLLPQCCVNNVFYYSSTCTSLFCHSAVSIRVLLPLYMYRSLLPQCCVNKGSDYPSTCTSSCCHSAVSIRVITTPLHVQVLTATVLCQYEFRQPLYKYKSSLPQCCVNKGSDYPSTCTSPYCHSAVSIRVPQTPLHVQVLTATVLCQ